MTREEEIKQAVENNLNVSIYTPQDGELLKETFYIGAKWADKNPQSPWISVKDDLPWKHEKLICSGDKNLTLFVITLVHGFIVQSRMKKLDGNWHWATDEPSHWFAIPELPKE